jgi:hypothetical protein
MVGDLLGGDAGMLTFVNEGGASDAGIVGGCAGSELDGDAAMPNGLMKAKRS